jgi:hypothetical protein
MYWVAIVVAMWIGGFIFAELIPVSTFPVIACPLASTKFIIDSSSINYSPSSLPSSPPGLHLEYLESFGSSCEKSNYESRVGARPTSIAC